MTLRTKPKRPKMGVKEPKRWVWNRHRAYLRSRTCSVPLCKHTDVMVAHLRIGHFAGMQQTPPDWMAIPLCKYHHLTIGGRDAQHTIGHAAFDRKYGINSLRIAGQAVDSTTDTAMRDYLREVLGMPNPARELRDEDVLGAEDAA